MTISARAGRAHARSLAASPRRPLIAVAVFCLVFLAIYESYLSKIWGYEGVNWQDPAVASMAVVVGTVIVTGVVMPRDIQRPSDFSLWIIYIIVVVPSALMAQASDWLPPPQRFPTAIGICAIAAGMRVLTRPSQGTLLPTPRRLRVNFWALAAVLLTVTYGWLIAAIGVNHAYISFLDIYTVRAEFKVALAGAPGLAYLLPLTYACINPALIVWGTLRRDHIKVIIGIAGDLLIYLTSGQRFALLSIPLLLWIAYQAKWGRPIRPGHLLAVFSFLIVFARVMDTVTGSLMWTAVFSMRILAIPGVLTLGYMKYFQIFPQLGLESFAPWFTVPGKNPLVLVGEWIFNTPGTNANVNFIGSGFMHAGVLGILIESAVAVLLLRLADDSAGNLPSPLRYSFFVMPAISLANGSAFTSVLTYGFGASFLLAYAARLDPRLCSPPTSAISTTPAPSRAIQRGFSMDIHDYLRILRRNWLLVLGIGVLAGAAGIASASLSSGSTEYVSKSALMVSTHAKEPTLYPGPAGVELARDYIEVATSRDTARQVVESLSLGISPEKLQRHVVVDVPTGTSVLKTTVTYPDAKAAQQINAATIGAVREVARLTTGAMADTTGTTITTTVIDSPSPGLSSGGGNKSLRNSVIALVLGLLAGFGLAVARELLDTSIKEPSEARVLDGVPVIGRITTDPALETGPAREGAAHSSTEEGIAALRANVQSLAGNHGNVVILTGPLSGGGTTTIAVATAIALARTGSRVVLVDANLRRPAVAAALGLDGTSGLTSILGGTSELRGAVQHHSASGLDVLAAGPVSENPSELLHSEGLRRVLHTVALEWDYVIVDSAPLLPVADTLGVAPAGSVALVVAYGKTAETAVAAATEKLDVVNAPLLGVVLNRTPADRSQKHSSYGSVSARAGA